MYCYVKYVCDGEKAIVPSTYVKDFDSEFDEYKRYEVFWSPVPGDTPLKLLSKQGKILTIDTQMEVNQKKISAPLPGYYYANILLVADTEEELVAVLDSKSGRSGKNKTVSHKKLKDKKSEIVQRGKKRSTELLFNNNKLLSVFSDSDSDDSVIPLKIHKKEIAELEKTIKIHKKNISKIKSENEILKTKFDEVYNLNIQLQKELLKSNNTFAGSSLLLSGNTSTVPSNPTSPPLSNINDIDVTEIQALESSEMGEVTESLPEMGQVTESLPEEGEDTEEEFRLGENHLARAILRVKPGQLGDSMFVKNISSAVFGDEVLVKSSVTGIRCNAKKNSSAKPALNPKGIAYIKKLFEERISKEQPECPTEEINKRFNKINCYIAEKIITLARKK